MELKHRLGGGYTSYKIGFYSSGFLAASLLLFLCLGLTFAGSAIPPEVSAANTDLSVTVNPSLSLVVDNDSGGTDVSMDASASSFGSLLKAGVSVRAGSNNETGYTLTFSDTDEDNDLVEESNSALTIPALSASAIEASFPADKWGYSLDGGDYAAVPLLSAPLTIDQTDAPGDTTHTVNFATKISNDTASGTYKDSTVFSLVANYVPPAQATFWTATTMQEFSQDTCDTVDTPSATASTIVTASAAYTDKNTQVPQTTLQDTRDNKYYIIRKLADGNCWMAQNLDLELSTSKTLTPGDTDVTANWTPHQNTLTTTGTTWTNNSDFTPRSYSPSATQTGDDYYINGTIKTTWPGSFPSNPNPTPSYLAGNYYTWGAATAGSGTSSTPVSTAATSSICPKGWKLPDNTGNKSFYNLLTTTYDIANNNTGASQLLQAPLSFVLSGYYYYANGSLSDQGANGRWWSSTTYTSAGGAYNLNAYSSNVAPQSATGVGNAFSIRCVTGTPSIQNNIASWCAAQPTPSAFQSDGTTINANVPETTMADARDGETYTIRKLADGNCWMADNLRLGKAGTTYTLDSTNTDLTTSITLPAATTSGTSTDNTLQVFYQNDANRQTYGNYYNWYTATATTGTASMSSGNATASICPKGMKLPPNTGNGSFQALTTAYSIANNAIGATKLQNAPLSFPFAGYYYNSGFSNQGSAGGYWSRTAYGALHAYPLYFTSSNVSPQSNSGKSYGLSVRCVLAP